MLKRHNTSRLELFLPVVLCATRTQGSNADDKQGALRPQTQPLS